MKFAVVQFPGTNGDQDVVRVIGTFPGASASCVWHKAKSLSGFDAVIIPSGFSYGDYLRCGAIAQLSPIMSAVKEFATNGGTVLGICNGFQILCESGLLPGALIRNHNLNFICEHVQVRVEPVHTRFTKSIQAGTKLNLPIAHGQGCYFAEDSTLTLLKQNCQVLLRYSDSNPNGSVDHIAGICNQAGNIFGLMPHPERACDPLLGSVDGRAIFESILTWK